MPHVEIRDIEMYYELHGDHGHTIVLVSGYGQNCNIWDSFIPPLTENYQVLTFDNRGAGRTSAPDTEYSVQQMAGDISGLMDALGINSAFFIGQSLGTSIILEMCNTHADHVDKAVLIGPCAHFPRVSNQNVQTGIHLLTEGITRRQLTRINAPWLLSNQALENPNAIEQFVDYITNDPHLATLEGMRGQAAALSNVDLREALPTLTQPLLLIAGEYDIATPLRCAEEIYDKASHCEMYIFPKQGHLLTFEVSEGVIERALNFLKE